MPEILISFVSDPWAVLGILFLIGAVAWGTGLARELRRSPDMRRLLADAERRTGLG